MILLITPPLPAVSRPSKTTMMRAPVAWTQICRRVSSTWRYASSFSKSLRRILLSSLEGSAVTQIKIHGAQHEFTTLPGVVEDMTDVVLNVKALVVKNFTDQTKVLRIEKNTRGVVTGADVITDDTVEIINKNHILATLNHCKGNRTHAANLLNVSIRTLRNKLHEYNGTTPRSDAKELLAV